MSQKNERMKNILASASKESTKKTYKEADTKTEVKPQADKKESVAGRKKIKESQKKKARQVFYSDEDFADIEKCAESMGIEAKTFMQMAINQKVKSCR